MSYHFLFVSAAFIGTDPPSNIANKKISEATVLNVKKGKIIPKVVTAPPSYSSTEINDEKSQSLKDEEIYNLKILAMNKLKEKDDEISSLREEISQIKMNFQRELKEKNDDISRLNE